MSEQRRLFPSPKPLLERLGEAFFLSIPAAPGIYLMFGEDGRVLYIGQSSNLRARLGSYKNARPETVSRKVIRLIHSTVSITWETCVSAEAARLRENDLLRTYRPRFNSANTYPQAYPYLTLTAQSAAFVLGITARQDPAHENFGAFKGRCWSGYAALVRLLYARLHQPARLDDYPCGFLSERPPKKVLFPLLTCWPELLPILREFLQGRSAEFMAQLQNGLPAPANRFEQAYYENELLTLQEFFERGAGRNYRLREQFATSTPTLGQAELDDLLVCAAHSFDGEAAQSARTLSQ